MSQSIAGYLIVGALAYGSAQGLGVVTRPAAGIEIHSLQYTEISGVPIIVQDRTVTAQGELIAQWAARIYKVEGAARKEVCAGGGYWAYAEGHKEAQIPINEWVGEKECYKKLAPGTQFTLCATYRWGDGGQEDYCEPQIFTKRSQDENND